MIYFGTPLNSPDYACSSFKASLLIPRRKPANKISFLSYRLSDRVSVNVSQQEFDTLSSLQILQVSILYMRIFATAAETR